jgi:hypothetical protein
MHKKSEGRRQESFGRLRRHLEIDPPVIAPRERYKYGEPRVGHMHAGEADRLSSDF